MAVAGCTFLSDDIVIKSPNDWRSYRYIQLSNGASAALLVHDPEIYSDSDGVHGDEDQNEDDNAD